jgi:hypothetical protein
LPSAAGGILSDSSEFLRLLKNIAPAAVKAPTGTGAPAS